MCGLEDDHDESEEWALRRATDGGGGGGGRGVWIGLCWSSKPSRERVSVVAEERQLRRLRLLADLEGERGGKGGSGSSLGGGGVMGR